MSSCVVVQLGTAGDATGGGAGGARSGFPDIETDGDAADGGAVSVLPTGGGELPIDDGAGEAAPESLVISFGGGEATVLPSVQLARLSTAAAAATG